MKQVIQAIQNNRLGIGAEIIKGTFPGGVPDGTIHTWKDGSRWKKQGGTWIGLKDASSGKKDDKKDETPTAAAPAAGKDGQAEQANKHDVAQLTHMKEVMNADPKKAYEIFQSLSPAAQHMVPQDVVNKMVKASHEDASKEGASFDDLGGDKKPAAEKKEPAKKSPEKKDGKARLKDFQDKDNAVRKTMTPERRRELRSEWNKDNKGKTWEDYLSDASKKEPAKKGADIKTMKAFENLAKTAKDAKDLMSKVENTNDMPWNVIVKFLGTYGGKDVSTEQVFKNFMDKHGKKEPAKKESGKTTPEAAKASLAKNGHKSPTDAMITKEQKAMGAMEARKPSPEQEKYFKDNKSAILDIMEDDIFMSVKDAVEQHQKDNPKDSPEAKFNAIFDKYDKKNYFGTDDLVKTQIGNWERAMGKGDEGAKQYTKEKVEEIVRGGQKALSKQSFDKMAEAIEKNDLPYLKSRLRYDQKFTKDIYESLTGKKLPSSTKAIHAMLDDNNDLKKALEVADLHNRAEMNMIIKGGKALPIGTKRTHGRVDVEKTAKGWVPVKKDSSSSKDVNEHLKLNTSDKFVPNAIHTKAQVMDHMFSLNHEKFKLIKLTKDTPEYNKQKAKITQMESRVVSDSKGGAIDLNPERKKYDHAKTAAMVALKNKFASIGTNTDGDYVRGSGQDWGYVQERAWKDLGVELKKTNTKSLEHGLGHFFEISRVDPNGAHAQTRDQILTLTKNINELKVKRNKLPAGSLKKQDLQARIDKLEGRFIKDKAGNKVGLRPMKENPSKAGSGIKSGSTHVFNITRKWPYMKRELEGISGKVDFMIVERDTKGLAGAQDKYRIEIHQNGKKVADMGTTPGLPQRGAKVSDNYKDTWRDHVGSRWASDLSPEMQRRTLPELKELNTKMKKRMDNAMESSNRRSNARELHRISSSLIRAHEMAEEANKKYN